MLNLKSIFENGLMPSQWAMVRETIQYTLEGVVIRQTFHKFDGSIYKSTTIAKYEWCDEDDLNVLLQKMEDLERYERCAEIRDLIKLKNKENG